MVVILISEFLIFSFLGWFIDSAYRSIIEKKLVNAGYFKGPVCPIYGVGGLVLIYLFKSLSFLSLVPLLLISSLALVLVEYGGGIFTEKVLKVKLWDYSASKFHLGGYIDLLHSFFWFVLTVFFYFFMFPFVLIFEDFLNNWAMIPESFNFPLLFVFVLLILWLTSRKNPQQFLDIKGKVLNLSVSDYQKLFSDFKKMTKTKLKTEKKILLNRVKLELSNSGGILKELWLKEISNKK